MPKTLGAIIAAANAVFVLTPSAAWAQVSPDRYGPHMMWWGGYGMFLGPLFMIVGLAVAIALALILVRWSGGVQGPTASPPTKTALDILKERFARGEIDKAEFEERRGILGE
ncbi:MAG TPA: hypothetical protein DHW63_07215 [Hyphomonadaceae bacterium]|mgnify:CR=1 FL=1|nr:hypothetical protein [Hyphomonadaceae bacterium]